MRACVRAYTYINLLLQGVQLSGGTDDKGLITTESNYKASHAGSTFNRLDTPLEAYDPEISFKATTNNHMRAE